jgi:histidyl-tRNA synthetase
MKGTTVAISAKPFRGTRDYTPKTYQIRKHVEDTILAAYTRAGFQRISTPILESAERLSKSEGGENLNLIFRILKRGEKLDLTKANQTVDDLSDCGLRYDLTMPLSRFYAANAPELRLPLKSIQIDRVFRAERPQKGRLREFIQCDIDIIGDETSAAEIELIDTTASALLDLGFTDFTIRVNDRRILTALIVNAGFPVDEVPSVSITFDKLDKVGYEGVAAELAEKGFGDDAINALIENVRKLDSLDNLAELVDAQVLADLRYVLETTQQLSDGRYAVEYDPSLVRGMGYYTGMVFEIASEHFSGSVGGGGRYDNMIGKFAKETVPAVGFSIGFERIVGILEEQQHLLPPAPERWVVLYGDETPMGQVLAKAKELRAEHPEAIVGTERRKKKVGKQFAALADEGVNFAYLMEESEVKPLQ